MPQLHPKQQFTGSFVLKRARLDQLASQATIGITGKRRTGKTTVAKELAISYYKQIGITRFFVVAGSKDVKLSWESIIPSPYVHLLEVALPILKALMDYQDIEIGKLRKLHETEKLRIITMNPDYEFPEFEIPLHLRVALFFDDCSSRREFINSGLAREIASNGRHYGFELVSLTQYTKQITPEIRQNLDYFGIMATQNINQLKSIWEEFLSSIVSLPQFQEMVMKCTEQKGSMLWIDNVSTSMNIQDKVFFYRSNKKFVENHGLLCTGVALECAQNAEAMESEKNAATHGEQGGIILEGDDGTDALYKQQKSSADYAAAASVPTDPYMAQYKAQYDRMQAQIVQLNQYVSYYYNVMVQIEQIKGSQRGYLTAEQTQAFTQNHNLYNEANRQIQILYYESQKIVDAAKAYKNQQLRQQQQQQQQQYYYQQQHQQQPRPRQQQFLYTTQVPIHSR